MFPQTFWGEDIFFSWSFFTMQRKSLRLDFFRRFSRVAFANSESSRFGKMRKKREKQKAVRFYLVGGFKGFLCSPLFGEMIQFDDHIFRMGGKKTPTSFDFWGFGRFKKHWECQIPWISSMPVVKVLVGIPITQNVIYNLELPLTQDASPHQDYEPFLKQESQPKPSFVTVTRG